MIEKTVLDYLNSVLSYPAFMEEDGAVPSEFVLIQKGDSTTENFVTTALIVITSHGSSLFAAATMNEEVIKAMTNLRASEQVSACRLVTDYNYTDTASKRYRYQAVFNITHY